MSRPRRQPAPTPATAQGDTLAEPARTRTPLKSSFLFPAVTLRGRARGTAGQAGATEARGDALRSKWLAKKSQGIWCSFCTFLVLLALSTGKRGGEMLSIARYARAGTRCDVPPLRPARVV